MDKNNKYGEDIKIELTPPIFKQTFDQKDTPKINVIGCGLCNFQCEKCCIGNMNQKGY